MGEKEDRLSKLKEQLDLLAEVVEGDVHLNDNMEEHVAILNSLKKQIEKANAMPDGPDGITGITGTKTGRFPSSPPIQQLPMKPATANPVAPKTEPPVVDRRAAVEHARKLHAREDGS